MHQHCIISLPVCPSDWFLKIKHPLFQKLCVAAFSLAVKAWRMEGDRGRMCCLSSVGFRRYVRRRFPVSIRWWGGALDAMLMADVFWVHRAAVHSSEQVQEWSIMSASELPLTWSEAHLWLPMLPWCDPDDSITPGRINLILFFIFNPTMIQKLPDLQIIMGALCKRTFWFCCVAYNQKVTNVMMLKPFRSKL